MGGYIDYVDVGDGAHDVAVDVVALVLLMMLVLTFIVRVNVIADGVAVGDLGVSDGSMSPRLALMCP